MRPGAGGRAWFVDDRGRTPDGGGVGVTAPSSRRRWGLRRRRAGGRPDGRRAGPEARRAAHADRHLEASDDGGHVGRLRRPVLRRRRRRDSLGLTRAREDRTGGTSSGASILNRAGSNGGRPPFERCRGPGDVTGSTRRISTSSVAPSLSGGSFCAERSRSRRHPRQDGPQQEAMAPARQAEPPASRRGRAEDAPGAPAVEAHGGSEGGPASSDAYRVLDATRKPGRRKSPCRRCARERPRPPWRIARPSRADCLCRSANLSSARTFPAALRTPITPRRRERADPARPPLSIARRLPSIGRSADVTCRCGGASSSASRPWTRRRARSRPGGCRSRRTPLLHRGAGGGADAPRTAAHPTPTGPANSPARGSPAR